LVRERVDDGRRLLASLDAKRFPIDAAFWVFYEDSNRWRLVVVSPVAERDSLKAYHRIRPVLDSMDPPASFILEDIWVMSKSSDVFKRVVRETLGGDGLGPVKGKTRESDDHSDAYIYRW
jgi:hypothetical protein